MLPVMVASGFSGPIAGLLCRGGCARWRPAGCCSAPSAFSAGVDRFQYQQWLAGADDAAGL